MIAFSTGQQGQRRPLLSRAVAVGVVAFAAVMPWAPHKATAAPAAAPSVTCLAEQPTATAAVAMAAACGAPVEDVSSRTQLSQVYINPTGTRTLVGSAVPQRVRRADGSWAKVDPLLRVGIDGYLVPNATVTDVRFSGGGLTPLVTWREGSSVFTVSWPAALPTPKIDRDTAVYAGVLPGVDLRVTATVTGYTQTLVVSSAQAAANPALREIHYRLGGSLQAATSADGGVELRDEGGNIVASSSGASMWDSSIVAASAGEVLAGVSVPSTGQVPAEHVPAEHVPAEGVPAELVPEELVSDARGPGAASRSAQVAVTITGDDMVVRPDVAMLTGASTVFPLFVDPPLNKQRSKWAYANTINSNWDVGNRMWVGRNPYDGTLYRSYFEFDISAIRGTTVLSASVTSLLDHSWSCGKTWVHLYRTGSITVASGARMAWSTRPLGSGATWVDSWEGNANEAGGCGVIQPDQTAVFDAATVRTDLQYAADSNWTGYTMGLCACNSTNGYESSQDRWKKFYTDQTYLIATYDKAPNAPTAQALSATTDCYAACVSPSRVRTTRPTLKVGVSDPFNGNLRTAFEVRATASDTGTLVTSTGSTPVTTAAPGTSSWLVPASVLVNGTTYYWRARSTDENNLTGGWSAWQTLTVDTTPPAAPTASSGQYPLRTWGAQVGTPGTFTLTGPSDVYDFSWSVDNGATTTVVATAGTASAAFTPTTDMVHTLHVTDRDAAGNTAVYDHQFWVAPVANKYAFWSLDQTTGSVASDTGSGGSTLSPGTVSGGATWAADASDPLRARFAHFDGTGQITAAGPVLDTTKAFTVAAWARPTNLAANDYQTVLSQAGSAVSRFQLQYRKDANAGAGGFCFSMRSADTASSPVVSACAPPVSWPVTQGQWVHLAGVFDPAASSLRVYVMGDNLACGGDIGQATFSGQWSATGSMVIGRSNNGAGGTPADWFTGDVDSVYAYQRVLAASEICQLSLQ